VAEGVRDPERLAELGRLGARLMLQKAEEVAAFLGRARYERTPEARGSRNGNRPRRVQTAEGELGIVRTRQTRPHKMSSAARLCRHFSSRFWTRPPLPRPIGLIDVRYPRLCRRWRGRGGRAQPAGRPYDGHGHGGAAVTRATVEIGATSCPLDGAAHSLRTISSLPGGPQRMTAAMVRTCSQWDYE
jgi:hypothetical protein